MKEKTRNDSAREEIKGMKYLTTKIIGDIDLSTD